MDNSTYYNDLDACPIVFLYRHAIELYLKSLIKIGHEILRISGKYTKENENFEKSLLEHNLNRLFEGFKYFLKSYNFAWDKDPDLLDELELVEKCITEFNELDPFSVAFRYPIDKSGKHSKPINFNFNVLIFAKKISKICEFLENFNSFLLHIREQV